MAIDAMIMWIMQANITLRGQRLSEQMTMATISPSTLPGATDMAANRIVF